MSQTSRPDGPNRFQRVAGVVNRTVVLPLLQIPLLNGVLGRAFTEVSYTGRKTGKHVTFPVNYVRSGDSVTIGVAMPDKKTWWRNFTGDGAPITLTLDGERRTGHAVASKDSNGSVRVKVSLDHNDSH
ncbi:hypothetical protein [Gordonia sputi]|uniref:DUF385 domain-containing protein n=1 Tax=Gordonia sputi NBRC 100414 TaxID=1089453 RepID=H5TWL2_9ACTN|nr:hypothetical protein [Gordonia sputi]NKY93567.1 hypothetical protein [Gordonia sputi]GAB37870.1 hypothetical protein GOSPT_022_02160 [Gordonia sputi NBRC 100414]